MEVDVKHLQPRGTLFSKNDLPLRDPEGNPTFQVYSPSQKWKTKKCRQITNSSAQTKEAPAKNNSSNHYFLETEHNTHKGDPELVRAFLNVL